MPQNIETVYARLMLRSYDDAFQLEERKDDVHERLFEVMNDPYYMEVLTNLVKQYQPADIEPWLIYRKERSFPLPETIRAIAKFTVQDQKVDLVEIRFH